MEQVSEEVEAGSSRVGDQLRAAREAKGLTLEEIANQTRIPRRHLEAIEAGDWSRLPAPTYTMGFAKSYASAVGVDRTQIGEELRAEMGGQRPVSQAADVYEPADPARTMPRWLVLAAIAAIVVAVLALSWWKSSDLEPQQATVEAEQQQMLPAANPPSARLPATHVPPPVAGPVVLTAREPVWIRVSERGGPRLYEGVLAAGATYQVPPSAQAPVLRTGKPEALVVTVGTGQAPPVGPPATTISDVSLLAPDLMRSRPLPGPGGPAAAAAAQNATR